MVFAVRVKSVYVILVQLDVTLTVMDRPPAMKGVTLVGVPVSVLHC